MASRVEVLTFDVFGTVVDWHSGIARAVAAMLPQVDAGEFAREWRSGYRPALARVEAGGDWRDFGPVHRALLDDLLDRHRVDDVSERTRDDLTATWSRLDPWPDAVDALTRLSQRFTVATLSNGDVEMLTVMAERAGLPWDRILGCDLFGHYKPAPEVYRGATDLLGVRPEQTMMVAAHHYDLDAAKSCGLQTAYIERPYENGRDVDPKNVAPHPDHPLHLADLDRLATHLGC